MQPVKTTSASASNQYNSQRAFPSPGQTALILACIVVAAAISILLGTARWGIGISPDSTVYVGAARSLLSSGTLLAVEADGKVGPLTHYPPLLPLLLAGASLLFHTDPISSARWLNAVCFGLDIGLLGVLAWRLLKSPRMAVLACLLGWIATPMIDIHLIALSEPPYLVFVLLSFLCLVHYSERRSLRWLLFAACSSALAFLCRYAGASLVGAELLTIAVLERQNLRVALKNVSIFALISCLPIIGWFIRNHQVSGAYTTGHLSIHWIAGPMLIFGFNSVSTWLLPGAVPPPLRSGIVFILMLSLIAAYIYARRRATSVTEARLSAEFPLVPFFSLFIVCHVAMLLLVASFVYGDVAPDDRNLLPLYGPGILMLLWILTRVGSLRIGGVPAWLLPALIMLLLAGTNGPRSASHLRSSLRDGRDFTSRQWQTSSVIGKLRALPDGVAVYTTLPSAVRFLTGHPTRLMPNSFSTREQTESGEDYQRNVLEMRRESEKERIAVVYLGKNIPTSFLPESEAKESLHLTLVAKDDLGTMYENELPAQTSIGGADSAHP